MVHGVVLVDGNWRQALVSVFEVNTATEAGQLLIAQAKDGQVLESSVVDGIK